MDSSIDPNGYDRLSKISQLHLIKPLLFSISTLIWIEVLVIGYIELDSEKRLYPGWQVLRPAFSIIMLSYNLYLHKQIMTEYTNPLRKNISEAHYGLASLRTCIKLV
ncbi:unnamed protein product [Brassica napus]|uniref:(rape) hypothetical protein n=1 Tax=Brassica napus TaxID=3708 RepID=A0A816UYA5_BRANA|nr:unnamed protein product [Brassica napus]